MKTEPEIITGLGEYRAGRGSIVTAWCRTREEAIAAYHKMESDMSKPDHIDPSCIAYDDVPEERGASEGKS